MTGWPDIRTGPNACAVMAATTGDGPNAANARAANTRTDDPLFLPTEPVPKGLVQGSLF